MGGIGKFLNLKGWHPSNKANQKKIWIAEQKAAERTKREQEAAAEIQKEKELMKFKKLAADAGEKKLVSTIDKTASLAFLYATPAGVAKTGSGENSGLAGEAEDDVAEDDAVKAFKAKIKSKTELRKLEKEAGVRPRDNLTVQEQVERFPILKDAPVEGSYTADIKVNFQPMGVQLRNVRCLRCGDWGHQSGDRECRLRDFNPHDAARQMMEDPLAYMQQAAPSLKEKLVLKKASLPSEMCHIAGNSGAQDSEYPMLMSDEEEERLVLAKAKGKKRRKLSAMDFLDAEDPEQAFLSSLSTKEKKLLLRKLKKMEGVEVSSSSDDSSSSSDDDSSSSASSSSDESDSSSDAKTKKSKKRRRGLDKAKKHDRKKESSKKKSKTEKRHHRDEKTKTHNSAKSRDEAAEEQKESANSRDTRKDTVRDNGNRKESRERDYDERRRHRSRSRERHDERYESRNRTESRKHDSEDARYKSRERKDYEGRRHHRH